MNQLFAAIALLFFTQMANAQIVDVPTPASTAISTETLAYHLATNADAHANGRAANYNDLVEVSKWQWESFKGTNLYKLTNAVWSTNFWLRGVTGLSATCIGFSNGLGGQGLITMVSPRHYLFATHMHPEGFLAAFLGTNNVIHWRKTLERADLTNDTSVGILDADLPSDVGFLPVLPANAHDYFPAPNKNFIQGLAMNQGLKVFSQPLVFERGYAFWDPKGFIPSGTKTNWSVPIVAGDSSSPVMFLIQNQLVLVSHVYAAVGGPDYSMQIEAINQTMHRLSVKNHAGTDYQLTPFPLKNWPVHPAN